VAIVAGLAWWSLARTPRTETVRGVVEPGSFALAAPRAEPGRVTIAWSAEPLAEAYRVVFIGADLAEVTHVEVTAATEYAMRRDSLPTGLVSGTHLSVEVVALRGGAPIATTEARPIRVP
jgi:hypothetical protein